MGSTKTSSTGARALVVSATLAGALLASPALAGIAFVQNVGTGGDATSGTSISVVIPPAGVTAGNTLIVSFAMNPASGTVSCGDSRGNAYVKDADISNGSSTNGVRTVVWSASIATALVAGDTIVITHPTATAKGITVNEFSGVAPSGAFDRSATATGTSAGPSSSFSSTTRQADELLIAAIGVETDSSEAFAAGSDYTALSPGSSGSGGGPNDVTVNPEYRIVSGLGSYMADGALGVSRLWAVALVTYRAGCGNAVLDPGEQCDKGSANSACCSADCMFETAGTECRAASGVCDAAETCTGASGSCPTDAFQGPATVCRPAADVCDAAETCNGSSATCPADGLQPAGTICRGPADVCDAAETCTGAISTCPADVLKAAGTVCRAAADTCDLVETCSGADPGCPVDASNPSCSATPAGAIGFVKEIGNAGDTTTGTALSVAVPAAGVAAGNTLIVTFAMDPTSGTVSCGDSQGNLYTKDADITNGSGTAGVRTVVCSGVVVTPLGTGDTVTVTHPTVAARTMSVNEFTGVAPTGAVDRTATATGTSNAPSSGFTATTRQADELVIGAMGIETHSVAAFAAGASYTALPAGSSGAVGGATVNISVFPEFRIVAVAGSYVADSSTETARLWAAPIVTYRATCGNAVLDPGEQCDKGSASSACCSATCGFRTTGTVCRAAVDLCDAEETCSGASGACPADALQPAGTICRAPADVCDAAETCAGTISACPADVLKGAGTVCRAAADTCDLVETCSGADPGCPADASNPSCSATPAGAIGFVKEIGNAGDTTAGTALSVAVPAAGVAAGNTLIVTFAMDPTSGTVSCGDSQGNVFSKDADVTNGSGTNGVRTVVCSGSVATPLGTGDTVTVTHPTLAARAMSVSEFTGVAPTGAVDRTATATGTSNAPSSGFTATTRQADELVIGAMGIETHSVGAFAAGASYTAVPAGSSGAVGGATANVSVFPEFRIVSIAGSYVADGGTQYARLWAAAVVTYRATCGNAVLDPGELCDRAITTSACCSASCQLQTVGTVCRATTDLCDAAETCTGASDTCPVDTFQPASTPCRAAVDLCDAAETCTGASAACPIDAFQLAGMVCRSPADGCDAAETCTGTSTTCPADGLSPAGTVCRAAADVCDLVESCSGADPGCPADASNPSCSGTPAGAAGFVKQVGSAGDTTTGTALSVAVPAAGVAAGNTLIVTFAMDPASGTVSCGDSQGNVYAADADVTNGAADAGVRTVVFSATVGTPLGPGDSITVTHPTATARAASASEFTGVASTGALDRTTVATGDSAAPSSGYTGATRQAAELLIGAIGIESDQVDSFAVGGTFTALAPGVSGSGASPASNVSVRPAFRVVSTIGSYAAAGSINPSRRWAAAIATYRASASCGNGVVDPGEQCDTASPDSGCCAPDCSIDVAGTVCRAAAGTCDVAESCTGADASCPADTFTPADTVCRTSAGPCDLPEACTGFDSACPADSRAPAGTLCRPASDLCDVQEVCSGASVGCPADALALGGTGCRLAAGPCDVAESCTGASAACPADAKSVAVCRPAAGTCDSAESCDGASNGCPANAFAPASTECRPSTNACDSAEYCAGDDPTCPADIGPVDGDGDDVCDQADRCPLDADPGQEDTDGDGIGDACDPCNNVLSILVSQPVLVLGNLTAPAGSHTFNFRGTLSLPPPLDEIDPAADGLRVVFADAIGEPLLDTTIPASTGWSVNRRRTTWRYRNPLGADGIAKILIRRSRKQPDRIQFVIVGRHASFPMDSWTQETAPSYLPLAATLVLDPPFAMTGQCGEAEFPGPRPAPQCTFRKQGTILGCS
jgi:hypothetical protein